MRKAARRAPRSQRAARSLGSDFELRGELRQLRFLITYNIIIVTIMVTIFITITIVMASITITIATPNEGLGFCTRLWIFAIRSRRH